MYSLTMHGTTVVSLQSRMYTNTYVRTNFAAKFEVFKLIVLIDIVLLQALQVFPGESSSGRDYVEGEHSEVSAADTHRQVQ